MCERVVMPNGAMAIVCRGHGRRARAPRCHYCTRLATAQCDQPTGLNQACDRYCCAAHSRKLGEDQDLCQECVGKCVMCHGSLDAQGRCWRCRDRRCERCARSTSSAFLRLCIQCDMGGAKS